MPIFIMIFHGHAQEGKATKLDTATVQSSQWRQDTIRAVLRGKEGGGGAPPHAW